MPTIRRLYLYLIALASLMALMLALINLSGGLIGPWINEQLGQVTGAEPTQGILVLWGLVVLISAPLWAVTWRWVNQTAATLTIAGAAERSASARKAYFYGGLCGALVALVAQAGLLAYDVCMRLLGQAPDGWPGQALALAAGTLIALGVWLYLRWVARGDGDVGHEAGAGRGWRQAYTYVSALLGTALAAAGAVELLWALVVLVAGAAPEVVGWRESAATALAAIAIGVPLAIYAWREADWLAVDDPTGAEINALGRKVAIYAGLLAGVLGTLVSGGFLVTVLCLLWLGLPVSDTHLLWSQTLAPALACLPVAAALWWRFGRALRNDMDWALESPDAATFRRLYFYVLAGLTLATFWYGLQQVVSVALFLALRLETPAALRTPQARTAFSIAAGLLVAAGPAWWWHWRRAQEWARQPGPAGHEERTSPIRKVYLYGVVVAAAAVVVVTLGLVIFRAPGWLLDPRGHADFVAALVQLGVAVGLALVWWIGNGLVMRTDARIVAQETAAVAAYGPEPWDTRSVGEAGGDTSANATDTRPGQYDRTQLPQLAPRAAAAGGAVGGLPPSQAPLQFAVVDGGNGAIGVLLLRELRQALPGATLWPIGLNDAAQQAMDQALGQEDLLDTPPDALAEATAILGPNDILIPGGLAGEVAPELAAAVMESQARKILLPPEDPRVRWAAAPAWPAERWVQQAVAELVAAGNASCPG